MSDYSKSWNRSKQPRKQRKFRENAPHHVKGKFVSAHLSEDLREEYDTRNARLRKGDTVKVVRGDFKGETGEVQRIDVGRQKVYVEGIEINRRDGSKAHPPVRPSNLIITELNTEDQRRKESLGAEEKEEAEEDES